MRRPSARAAHDAWGMLAFLCASALGCTSNPSAPSEPQRSAYEWVTRFSDALTAQPTGVAVDATGDVLVTGSFVGTLDVGPTPLTASPQGSLFVVKLDANGHAVWSTSSAPSLGTEGHAVGVDHAGNILLAGRQGASQADPATTLADGFFVAKLDPSGKTLWQTPLSKAYDTFNLSVSGGGFALLSARTASGLFVEMVDPTGSECWNLSFPLSCTNGMAGIATNESATLAITGFYDCPVDFGGGPLKANGRQSLFVTTFDSNGNFVWSRGFGASGGDVAGRSVALDDAGAVFVAGNYSGSPDFGGGPLPPSAAGLFVVALDPKGAPRWSHGYDGAAMAAGQSLVLGSAGQVFVMGAATTPVDLGAGVAEPPGTFVLTLTAAGAYGGVNRFVPQGVSLFDGAGLAIGAENQLAFAGSAVGTVTFGATSERSVGVVDAVVGVLAP